MKNIFKLTFLVSIIATFSFAFFGAGFGGGYSFGMYKPKKGFWTEYIINSTDGDKAKMKTIFAGETTYKGKKAYAVEMQIKAEGQTMPTMTLFDAKDFNVLKMAMQTPMGLMCQEEQQNYPMGPDMENNMQGSTPSYESPKDIEKKYPKIKHATYTTPTGKKVKCTVYKTTEGEVWINPKIGLVKIVENGKNVMYLRDFGNNGKTIISVSQVKNCKPLAMPMMPMVPMGGMPQ